MGGGVWISELKCTSVQQDLLSEASQAKSCLRTGIENWGNFTVLQPQAGEGSGWLQGSGVDLKILTDSLHMMYVFCRVEVRHTWPGCRAC